MFRILFNIIINLIATVIQIVMTPLNLAISSVLPDLSSKILEITTGIPRLFGGVYWALGILPPAVLSTLIFIIGIEIAKHTIFLSTHTLIKVWNLLQKLKFW